MLPETFRINNAGSCLPSVRGQRGVAIVITISRLECRCYSAGPALNCDWIKKEKTTTQGGRPVVKGEEVKLTIQKQMDKSLLWFKKNLLSYRFIG